jgi:hypothetical protein
MRSSLRLVAYQEQLLRGPIPWVNSTWYYFHLATDYHADLRTLASTGIESTLPEASHEL